MSNETRKPLKPFNLAAVSSICLALAGCGGGGGGGVPFIPPPPVIPPPSAPGLVSAPARATVGAGPGTVFATQGGPNFNTGPAPGTAFPLLQSAMTWNGTRVEADSSRNAAGATATVEGGQIMVTHDDSPTIGHANLDWARVGSWDVPTDWFVEPGAAGAFVIGYETPASAVPASGTAQYAGLAEGTAFYPDGSATAVDLTGGTALFTADFGARTVAGNVTGLSANGVRWNDFGFSSTISTNSFSGTTSVTTAPGGIASLAANATGTIEGRFFGPSAQEAGAVWTLFDGTRAAIGTLSGERP